MKSPPTQSAEAYGYHEPTKHPAWVAAELVAPIVYELFEPKQVVDIGCGVGIWLRALQEAGVEKIMGVDGDWVQPELLVIPPDCFLHADLHYPDQVLNKLTKPFDLVMSLEVAEHLPETCADEFIRTLTSLGDLILFSAAVPKQGGHRHINEQWQSYWAHKFARHGFRPFDLIRPRIVDQQRIQLCYRQNIVIYAREASEDRCSEIAAQASGVRTPESLDYVLPEMFTRTIDPKNYTFHDVRKVLLRLLWDGCKRRLKQLVKRY